MAACSPESAFTRGREKADGRICHCRGGHAPSSSPPRAAAASQWVPIICRRTGRLDILVNDIWGGDDLDASDSVGPVVLRRRCVHGGARHIGGDLEMLKDPGCGR